MARSRAAGNGPLLLLQQVLGIEPRALYIQGKNFPNQAIIPATSLKKKIKLRGLEEEKGSNSICHPIHASIVLVRLTTISLKSEANDFFEV